jgi:predicted AAA+ superfamily ATPase
MAALKALKPLDMPMLKVFEEYLAIGYYPYFRDAPSSYGKRLEQTIATVLSQDIALAMNIDAMGVAKLKKLFAVIASSKPMTPNINGLSRDLGATRDTVYKYLFYLERAGLIRTIFADISKVSHILSRPDKVCISNPNILQTAFDARLLSERRGALRESFFVSNFLQDEITVARDGDFGVQDIIFEIGGPNKNDAQIRKQSAAFVVRDGQEIPAGRSLPLWIFGFVY